MSTDVKPARGRPNGGAREAIIEAARELFAKRGYAAVSTNEMIERAGVSRGAMYHHFPGKLELFEALYVEMELELIVKLNAAAQTEKTPIESLRAGSHAYLDQCERPSDWARINLRQSREVLGLDRWRELASELGIGAVRAAVAQAMEAGEMKAEDPSMVASVYLAALIEGALQVADAPYPQAARPAVERTIDRLLDGLRA